MKRIITALFIAAGIITIAPLNNNVFAQPATVNADCNGVTITAPAGEQIIFSLDSEPPMSVSDGATATPHFFAGGVDANLNQYTMDSHHWSAGNVTTGEYQSGDVTGCAPEAPQPVVTGYVNPDPLGYSQPVIEYKVPETKTVVATAEPVTVPEVVTMRTHGPW
jgi:hypothetical protein